MELSIREAKARFAEAAAAASGLLSRSMAVPLLNWFLRNERLAWISKAAYVRRALGLDGLKVSLPPNFDNPAFSRHVLGLPD